MPDNLRKLLFRRIQDLQKTFLKKTSKGKKVNIATGKEVEMEYHINEVNPKANFDIWDMMPTRNTDYTDMFKAGIIDPTKVVISALSNAVSAAAMLLTTEAVVTDIPEKKEKGMPRYEVAWEDGYGNVIDGYACPPKRLRRRERDNMGGMM